MLTISTSQMEHLRRARIEEFVKQMLRYFASEYPTQCGQLGPEGMRSFVERSMEAAKELGFVTQGAISALAELRLVYGENLERAPDKEWARNILANKRLPDYIKVETVQNRLQEKTGGRMLVAFPAVS